MFLIAEIARKPANLTNLTESDKSDKSLCNSILVPYFRRIFVQTNLLFSLLGSDSNRGRSPVKWVDLPYMFVHLYLLCLESSLNFFKVKFAVEYHKIKL